MLYQCYHQVVYTVLSYKLVKATASAWQEGDIVGAVGLAQIGNNSMKVTRGRKCSPKCPPQIGAKILMENAFSSLCPRV